MTQELPSFGSDGEDFLPKLSDGASLTIKILDKPETYMHPEYGMKYKVKIKVIDGLEGKENHILIWSSISGALKFLHNYMDLDEKNEAACYETMWKMTGKATENDPSIVKIKLTPIKGETSKGGF